VRRRKLRRANRSKAGEPYHYPASFTELLTFVRLLLCLMPYRQTEGFVRFLSGFVVDNEL